MIKRIKKCLRNYKFRRAMIKTQGKAMLRLARILEHGDLGMGKHAYGWAAGITSDFERWSKRKRMAFTLDILRHEAELKKGGE